MILAIFFNHYLLYYNLCGILKGNLSDFLLKYFNAVFNHVSMWLKSNKLSRNTANTHYIILHGDRYGYNSL